ncbi:SDR family NAD(P)-dependent oxidoreductase [Microbacterium sp.]|uniref:SDR family NAD(P)-dependent oxidoreductase n=1 Tax=Microbacterium sp. TaxID=51671 RepID=UPI003A863627
MALFRENPVVVITGGAGGIGSTIARSLQELGATVVVCDFGQPDPYGFDVRDRLGWEKMMDQVISDHGRVDVLINNAGVMTQGDDTVVGLDDDEWHRVFDINVTAVRIGMSVAIARFGEEGGRIINTASVSGVRHFPGACIYSVSKTAVIALTNQAALDYSHRGIKINAIAPGMMENVMHHGKGSDLRDKVIASSLTGDAVKDDEVALTVEYLLDARNSNVVGATMPVDAGFAYAKGNA